MSQLFISHVEEDQAVAIAIGDALEQKGFGVWYYERDSVPGPSYLLQIIEAIKQCEGVILVVSSVSLDSPQVDAEVGRAFSTNKRFVPLLHGVTHDEFESRRPEWVMSMRSAAAVSIPPAGVSAIFDLLERGVKKLGVKPARLPVVEEATPADVVECTLFSPPRYVAGEISHFQIWLHTSAQSEDVEKRAEEADVDTVRIARKVIGSGLARGERLRLSLKLGGHRAESLDENELTWNANPVAARFAVEIPAGERSKLVGQVKLFLGATALTSLLFQVRPKGRDAPLPPRINKAYLCYASEDRLEVLKRAQAFSYAGVSVFMDTFNMEPGQNWEKQIYRRIDEADAFILFWSEAASRSEWVRREVLYALRCQGGDPDKPPRIIPVVLSLPMPQPPPELMTIHFSDTWSYLIAAESSRMKG